MSAALEGMRILDLTQYEAGPSCTQALALLGADVLKVERPDGGDPGRAGFSAESTDSDYFLTWNANKRSLALALERPEGRDLLLRLLPRFDVVVENFGPGVSEKLGIDAAALTALHPSLIYASVKGFGGSGPLSGLKCFDAVAQAASGALSVTGAAEGEPQRLGVTLGDCGAGMQLALAICAAYIQRSRTGEGQVIEISMQEALTYYLRTTFALGAQQGDVVMPRLGNRMGPLVDLFPCAPGGANDFVYIMAVTARMWEQVTEVIERPDLLDDERFATAPARRENVERLHEIVGEWTARRTKFEAMEQLGRAGVPASAVYDSKDLYRDPHLIERGFVHELEHPERGRVRLLGFAPRLSRSKVRLRAAPLLGEHTEEILTGELELDAGELEELVAKGVVSARDPSSS